MTTRPTINLPRWAADTLDALASSATEPGDSKKAAGWSAQGEKPNRQHTNWLLAATGIWLKYLAEGGGAVPEYASLEEFIGDAGMGDHAFVVKSATPWSQAWSVAHGAQATAVACDGLRVFVGLAGGTVKCHDRTDGAELWSETGFVSDPTAMVTDGERVFVAFGATEVTAFDVTDGTNAVLASTASNIVAIATDGTYLYVAHSSGHVEARSLASGAQVWNDTTLAGEAINGIATDGQWVWVALDHNAGGVAYGAVRLGVDGSGLSGSALPGNDNGNSVTVDAAGVAYVGGDTQAIYALGMDPGNAASITPQAGIGGMGVSMVAHPEFLITTYISLLPPPADHGLFVAHNPGGLGGALVPAFRALGIDACAAASDGDRTYFASNPITGDSNKTLIAYELPGHRRRFVRTATTDRYRAPFYGLATPER